MCMMNVFQLIVRNFFSRMSRCSSFFNHHVGIKKRISAVPPPARRKMIFSFFLQYFVCSKIYLLVREEEKLARDYRSCASGRAKSWWATELSECYSETHILCKYCSHRSAVVLFVWRWQKGTSREEKKEKKKNRRPVASRSCGTSAMLWKRLSRCSI